MTTSHHYRTVPPWVQKRREQARTAEDFCSRCFRQVETVVVPRPETPHAGGQVVCRDCGSHIRWQRKEENLGRRKKSKIEPGDHCERCNLQRDDLPDHETLESHHRDGNPQNNAIENIETLCTACHTQLHHDRFYRGHFAEKTQRLGNDVVRYLVATSLATSAVEKVRGILGIRDESS